MLLNDIFQFCLVPFGGPLAVGEWEHILVGSGGRIDGVEEIFHIIKRHDVRLLRHSCDAEKCRYADGYDAFHLLVFAK